MGYKDKEKQRAYQNAWAQQRRVDWLQENGPCVKCGSNIELEVDHIDASQKVAHRVWTWSKERRDEELNKCQVLCLECHKAKTKADRPPVQHGTDHKYNLGCRCDGCRAFKSRKNARRIRKRK
jgi:5-methylcytosine-specific restriction endonuclease McrA